MQLITTLKDSSPKQVVNSKARMSRLEVGHIKLVADLENRVIDIDNELAVCGFFIRESLALG